MEITDQTRTKKVALLDSWDVLLTVLIDCAVSWMSFAWIYCTALWASFAWIHTSLCMCVVRYAGHAIILTVQGIKIKHEKPHILSLFLKASMEASSAKLAKINLGNINSPIYICGNLFFAAKIMSILIHCNFSNYSLKLKYHCDSMSLKMWWKVTVITIWFWHKTTSIY